MRVAFFTQGAQVPAARFRVEQMLPALAPRVESVMLPAYPSVYGDTASIHGRWRALAKPFSIVSRLRQLGASRDVDAVWMQRPVTEYFTTVFERHLAARKPTVFDFDDAIFHNRWGLEGRKVNAIADRVDHVVAGNAYLAEFVARPEKTTIIPTVVDEHRYSVRPDPGDTPFTIVWTGMSHNLKELAPWAGALRRVLSETGGRLVIAADALDAPFLEGMNVEFVKWSPATEVEALAAGHVGVMPLADTRYNRGKCAFKLIQYMARGLPVVCSPVGANVDVVRDERDGFHARDEQGWIESLLHLARDREARIRMGAAGRERVEQSYSVTAVAPRYLDVLEAIV